MKKLKINYNLVEDDDKSGNFYESKIYMCNIDEMILLDNKIILLVIKIIEIK